MENYMNDAPVDIAAEPKVRESDDRFRANDYKVQFSFTFSYSAKIPR